MVPRALLSLVAVLAVAAPVADVLADGWSAGAPMPTARSELTAAATEDRVYAIGGIGGFGTTAAVEVYDGAAGTWVAAPDLPVGVHHAAAAALDGRIYVIGGYDGLGFRLDVMGAWALEPGATAWRAVAALPAPRGAELWSYDPASDTWATGHAPMPTPREHLAAAAIDGKLYAVGGRWNGDVNTGALERYDPATDTWETLAPMPTPRGGLAAGVLDGRLHVVGGEDLATGATFDAHEIYDPATDTWSRAPGLSVARHGLAAAVVNDRLYVVGGGEAAGWKTFFTLSDAVDVFPAP